jgi:hypothetical protein
LLPPTGLSDWSPAETPPLSELSPLELLELLELLEVPEPLEVLEPSGVVVEVVAGVVAAERPIVDIRVTVSAVVPTVRPAAASAARRSRRRTGGCVVMGTTVVVDGSARPQCNVKLVLSRARWELC